MKRVLWVSRRLLVLTSCASLVCLGCVSSQESTPPSNALRIGTVLPFSGDRATSGAPLEAALRLAVAEVNAAGGLAGRPLWLDIADSHSDDLRGTDNAINMIENNEIPFFIGTEEPKITYQITSAVKKHNMVHLMPGLTTAQFHDPSSAAAWFRLSPSVSYLSCALAKRVLADGLSKVFVVVDDDDYSTNFAIRFGAVMQTKAHTSTPSVRLDQGSASFSEVFSNLIKLAPEAVVLMASPPMAARFLQEWAVRDRPMRIYLGPTLKDPALLRNVPMGILDGLTGVSADLGEQAPAFATYLVNRTAVLPTAGSYYYFDAVALLSLALAEGIANEEGIPTPASIKTHMLNVTSTAGEVVSFDTLSEGFNLLAAKKKISYQGAAGWYVLSSLGDSTLNRGSIWQIKRSDFVTVGSEQCDRSDIDNIDPL